MAVSPWWAASGSVALLLALGSIHSSAYAGEKSTCKGGVIYDSYQCFRLEEDDVESAGTFVNGEEYLQGLYNFKEPRLNGYKFGYVAAYFVPSETGQGLAGNNSHKVDTIIFTYDGIFEGGDLAEEAIGNIQSFNDDWNRNNIAPPNPNLCRYDRTYCPQVERSFVEGDVITFVVSHFSSESYAEFINNAFPLSFYSSVAGDFYEEITEIPNLQSECGDVTIESPEQITKKCVENIIVAEGAVVEGNLSYGVDYFPSVEGPIQGDLKAVTIGKGATVSWE